MLKPILLGLLLATPAIAEEPVTIRYLASHGSVSPHELAAALGYYDDLGIEIENIGYATGGPESLFALASGSVDMGSAATAAVINSIAGGNDFVAAYPTNGIGPEVQSIFYVPEDSPIRTIEDIAGKTIAVNTLGAHLDYAVREALHQKGLPQDAANLITVPGPQLEQTLRSGQVDIAAFGYWQTTFEGVARQNGGLRAVFGDADVLGEIAGGFVTLRRDFIEDHPQAARNFVKQAERASEWARQNPEETRKVFATLLEERGENPEIAQHFRGFGVREGGHAEPRDLQFWIDVLERDGALPEGKFTAADLLFDPDTIPQTN